MLSGRLSIVTGWKLACRGAESRAGCCGKKMGVVLSPRSQSHHLNAADQLEYIMYNTRMLWICVTAVAVIGIAACGPRVPVVNVDRVPQATRDSALNVRVFLLGSIVPPGARSLGAASAYSCKHLMTDPPATQGNALLQLQIKTIEMGGNAIINVTFDTRGTDTLGTNCWQTVTASGIVVRLP